MPISFKEPKWPGNVPFFLYDVDNFQLITTPTIPSSDIKDIKSIIYTEVPVPGMNFQPVQVGGGGNRHVQFTLPLIRRNNNLGNIALLKQFDMLRNQKQNFLSLISTGQFTGFPKVLFYYGVGSVPLLYFVFKADPTHKQGWTNSMGNPQYSEIEVELVLDENNWLYKGELVFRKLQALAGTTIGTANVIKENLSRSFKPY